MTKCQYCQQLITSPLLFHFPSALFFWGGSLASPLSAAPRLEGAAVARVGELGLGQLGQARQRREGPEGEGGAGSEEPHPAQASGRQRAQSCGGNIPGHRQGEKHTQVFSRRRRQRAWGVCGVRWWNRLEAELKRCPSMTRLKKRDKRVVFHAKAGRKEVEDL